MAEQFDVYISYRSDDQPDLADKAANYLRDQGLHVWYYKWYVGDADRYNWLKIARDALQQCKTLAIMVGPKGLGAGQLQELTLAQSFPNIRILPVLIPKANQEKLSDFLQDYIWVDLKAGLDDQSAQTRLLESISENRVYHAPQSQERPSIADQPIDMPVDVLLAIPGYITQSGTEGCFNLWDALPKWLTELSPERVDSILRTHWWMPNLEISSFPSFNWATERGLVTANKNDKRRLKYFPGLSRSQPRPVDDQQISQFEVVHFQGQIIRNGLFLGGQRFVYADILRHILGVAFTRLLILNVPLGNLPSARRLADEISNQRGPSVLVVADSDTELRDDYFTGFYDKLFRNLPLSEIVTPQPEADGSKLQVWSYGSTNAEDLFLFTEKANQLKTEVRNRVFALQAPIRRFSDVRRQFYTLEAPALHRAQIQRLGNQIGGVHFGMLGSAGSESGDFGFDVRSPSSSPTWSLGEKSEGIDDLIIGSAGSAPRNIDLEAGRISFDNEEMILLGGKSIKLDADIGDEPSIKIPRVAIEMPALKNVLMGMPKEEDILNALDEFLAQSVTEQKKAPRVLNANFANPLDEKTTLPLNASLGAGLEYDLRVDVGPRWDKNPSLFQDEKLAEFPDKVVDEKLLTPEDRERGAFDVLVVFVSEQFTPRLVTATISVPTVPTSRSIPYINGQLAKEAGWVSLHVRAPKMEDAVAGLIIATHGRLSLYYNNNLLQSGSVHVSVSAEPGLELEKPNSGEIDFVLTGGFQEIEETFDLPVSISEGLEQKVGLNLTVNDDGAGNYRVVVVSQINPDTPTSMPAAWMPYNLGEAKEVLDEARKTLIEIIKPLQNKPTKSRDELVDDLKKLAIVGSKVRNKFILSGLNIEDQKDGKRAGADEPGMTDAQWVNLLFKKLESAGVIQVARTGPASYVFPWGLLYEYPMEGPQYRTCDVITREWDEKGQRKKTADASCPYKNEEWHKQNVICPYGFWGLKHVIEQPASGLRKQNDQWRMSASPWVRTNGGFPITLIATEDVDQDSFQEHITSLKKLKGVRFEPVDTVYDKDKARDVLHAPQIVYFLCHGEWEPKSLQERENAIPYLSIGSHDEELSHKIFPTTLTNWSVDQSLDADEWAHHRPLVIINGCETANVNPKKEANFVTAFDYLGASGVIGTEVSMLVDAAYEVAQELMSHLTEGGQIGRAVRDMRWKLLNKGSLIGLAYTPYCRAVLHVENEA